MSLHHQAVAPQNSQGFCDGFLAGDVRTDFSEVFSPCVLAAHSIQINEHEQEKVVPQEIVPVIHVERMDGQKTSQLIKMAGNRSRTGRIDNDMLIYANVCKCYAHFSW